MSPNVSSGASNDAVVLSGGGAGAGAGAAAKGAPGGGAEGAGGAVGALHGVSQPAGPREDGGGHGARTHSHGNRRRHAGVLSQTREGISIQSGRQ
eukprot:1181456-Prorocentrum_minimum.AAC.4